MIAEKKLPAQGDLHTNPPLGKLAGMGRKTTTRHAQWRAAEKGEPLPHQGRQPVCAVYPGPYDVAMANLGYQWLFHALARAGFGVGRVVWPEKELSANVQADTLRTIDDDRPAGGAAVWFVSLSFENDLVRLAGLLRLAGVPVRPEERRDQDPLIVAGGIVPTMNPEPTSALADVCLLGEGNAVLHPFLDFLKDNDPTDRDRFLAGLRDLPGAYVGRFYAPHYSADGTLTEIKPLHGFPERVLVPKEDSLDPLLTCTHLRAPSAAFGDALLIETARGCVQRCRFCAAGHIFLPFRPAAPPKELPNLGENALGLVGSNVSGHPHLAAWIELAGARRVTLSSLRTGAIDRPTWRRLTEKGLASVAIAPEAGTERLRRVCNKPTSDEDILADVRRAAEAGIRQIKLYFLIGLPTETAADIEAIIDLSRHCRETAMTGWKHRGRAGSVTVSVNPFIPKPQTPFQWQPMEVPVLLAEKTKNIKQALRSAANIKTQFEPMPAAMLQAILSVGDRRAGELIILADRHNNLRSALRAWPENPDFYLTRPRSFAEVLPWDHIDLGISRRYLEQEYRASLTGKTSPACFTVPNCRLCGVCR